MMKVFSCRFYKSVGAFNIMTVKECSETVFLESFLSKSLTVCNFQKKVAMTIIFFFSKCLKFDVDYWNGTKKSEKVFGFEVSYI